MDSDTDSDPELEINISQIEDSVIGEVTCPCCRVSISIRQTNSGQLEGERKEDQMDVSIRPRNKARKRLFSQTLSEDDDPSGKPDSIQPTPRHRFREDHKYSASPRQMAEKYKFIKKELEELKVKYKQLQTTFTHKQRSEVSLKDALEKIKSLNGRQGAVLQAQFPAVVQCIIDNEEKALKTKGKTGMIYDEEMKRFAATLYFYSPKAYRFLRHHMALPHPKTISSWMQSSNCGPGFNVDVLDKLGDVRARDTSNVMTEIVIVIDEMAIRQQLVWHPSKNTNVGHIDYGCNGVQISADAPLASNALVCMISGLSGGWKCPIGYIFTNKTDADIQKTFLDQAFTLLEERNFNVRALICDGNTANVALFDGYGVLEKGVAGKFSFDDIVSSFPNPANPIKTVYAIYDIVHMMKLWRGLIHNSFTKEGSVSMSDGREVSWAFIERLYALQTKENIRAANKLGRYHIDFANHKMNVKLAVQTVSKSVADSITFCRDSHMEEFEGSEGTTSFLYKLDEAFDILNSRSPCQKRQKAPLSKGNFKSKSHFLTQFCEEILKMKHTDVRFYKKTGNYSKIPKLLVESDRKRAAIGMVVSIKSILCISHDLLFRKMDPFKYVLTYRFCQDPLELFFNKIRGRQGCNNNPNVVEFEAAMKSVWHQNLLRSTSTGNCIEQMRETSIPEGLLPLKRVKKIEQLEMAEVDDMDVIDICALSEPSYSDFYKNCLAYISGNVVRVVGIRLKCETCAKGMFNTEEDRLLPHLSKLIESKDRGGLFTPCQSVYRLVELADSCFTQLVKDTKGALNIPGLDKRIAMLVTKRCIGINLFPHLQHHVIDFDPMTSKNHLSELIERIVLHYLKIRLFDHAKRFQKMKLEKTTSTRHKFSKLTIINGF